jgi:hypothetical protein
MIVEQKNIHGTTNKLKGKDNFNVHVRNHNCKENKKVIHAVMMEQLTIQKETSF